MSRRASSSVVGVVVLLAIAVLASAVVGATVLGVTPESGPPHVRITASADAARDRIALTHRGGDALAVADLRLVICIDGQPLAHQPPVPFFAATGFASGPTGPFNSAFDGHWTAGQTAAFRLAGTNSPQLSPGATVTIRIYTDHYRLATVRTQA